MKTGEYARLIKGAGNAAGLHKCRLVIGELRHGELDAWMGPQVRVTVDGNEHFTRYNTITVLIRHGKTETHHVSPCHYSRDDIAGFSFWVSPYVLCPDGMEAGFPYSLRNFCGKGNDWNDTHDGAPIEQPEPATTEPTTETTPAAVPETSTTIHEGETMEQQQGASEITKEAAYIEAIAPTVDAAHPDVPTPPATYQGPDRRAEIDLLKARAVYVATFGASVVITGAWIWARFQRMPESSIRDRMKSAGFKWSKNKEKWYYAGSPSRARKTMGWQYIKNTYGMETVTEDDAVTA